MDFFIATPSLNQSQFLRQTLESVAYQETQHHIVHWVFDAKSSDHSTKILRQFRKPLHWRSEADRGQSHAINKGIAQLKTWLNKNNKDPDQVIFAFLNSDDYYLSGSFDHVAVALKKNPLAEWLVGDCLIVNQHNQSIKPLVRLYKKLWRSILSIQVLGVLNPIPQPATFLRASTVLKVGPFNEKLTYTMDYEYWLRAWKKVGPPLRISQPLAAFRVHSETKGVTGFRKQFAEQLEISKKFFNNPQLLTLQKFHNKLTESIYNRR